MSDSCNPKCVAVIGLGNMGSALAEALLSAGCPVIKGKGYQQYLKC